MSIRRFLSIGSLVVAGLVAGLVHGPVYGQTPAATFMGVKVEPASGVYIVLKDANLRARPLTKGKRLGRVEKGTRVEAVGRVKGPWLAIRTIPSMGNGGTGEGGAKKAAKILGFVYGPILMPIIDGALSKELTGTIVAGNGRRCRYLINFEGKSEAQGQIFEFSDYSIEWDCTTGGRRARFSTPMFMTEGPHVGTQKPVHQITLDIQDLENGPDDVFSTHLLWDRRKGLIKFDVASVKKFVKMPIKRKGKSQAAAKFFDVPTALHAAVRLAHNAWRNDVWRALMTRGAEIKN